MFRKKTPPASDMKFGCAVGVALVVVVWRVRQWWPCCRRRAGLVRAVRSVGVGRLLVFVYCRGWVCLLESKCRGV